MIASPRNSHVAPDPPLSDGRLALRPWRLADVPAVAAACADADIAEWLDAIPQPYRERDARAYVEFTIQGWRDGTVAAFAVTDAGDGALLGSIAVRWVDRDDAVAEVGYWVAAPARGRGVATAALRLVSGWAFDALGVERLQLRAATGNVASQRVAERAGFRREGVLRSAHWNPRRGERVDWVMYSLLPGELGT